MTPVNKNFSYREILKKSFQIVKKNRGLWFFGFFAAVIGAGGEFEVLFKDYSSIGKSTGDILNLNLWYQGGVLETVTSNLGNYFKAYPWQAFFLLLISLVIVVVVIWLAFVSQIALFDAADKLSRNKKTTLTDGFQVGNQKIGRVVAINVVIRALVYAFFLVITLPLLSWFVIHNNILGGILFVIFLFLVYIPVSVIAAFILRYALAFIVLKGQSAGQAVRSGWELFKKNWLTSLEMALIVLVAGLFAGLIILIALGLASIPFFIIGIASLLLGSTTGLYVAVVIGVITWFIVMAIIGSAYVSFQYTAWTLLFLQLVGDTAQSKLARWFGKLSAKNIA